MITLSILGILLYIYTTITLHKKSKKKKESFNPFNGNIFEFAVWVVGAGILVTVILFLIIKYLP
jgi:hypothetical protein